MAYSFIDHLFIAIMEWYKTTINGLNINEIFCHQIDEIKQKMGVNQGQTKSY